MFILHLCAYSTNNIQSFLLFSQVFPSSRLLHSFLSRFLFWSFFYILVAVLVSILYFLFRFNYVFVSFGFILVLLQFSFETISTINHIYNYLVATRKAKKILNKNSLLHSYTSSLLLQPSQLILKTRKS